MPLVINGLASSSITLRNGKDLGFLMERVVHYLDMKSLTGLGQWLLQCWNHCQEKKTSAKKGLRKSGINIQTLQAEWEAQVSVQTKPASRHSAKATENFIMQMMATQKSLETYEARLDELEKGLLQGGADMTNLNIHIQLHMHALAIKKHIQDCLCQQKFELERLEQSYQQTVSALICQGKAPQGAIAPILIQRDGLFKLDVDDDIWQDIGLEDDFVGFPPAWSLLELKRCEEEERRLLYKRKTLMEWHSEEWRQLEICRVDAGADLAYELDCRASALASLSLLWQEKLRDFPGGADESWEARVEEWRNMDYAPLIMDMDRNEEVGWEDLESENDDGDDEMLDDDLLCVAEEFALADEYHQQFSEMSLTEFSWADDWELDVLDMDPPSSPSKRPCR
ncbi:hypothetical protein BKA82DRAFT_4013521 [Pisolithus tinctorius]|nr:hypothetical protein BKA82DRAFT_4013521 [Pisolithus tinctorius]